MRILITTDVEGGVWNFTLSLVRELRRLGDECLIAIIGSPTAAQLREVPRNVAWQSRDLRLEWMNDAGRDVMAAGEWIRRLADDWAPDVIHLNQFAYAGQDLPAPTVVVAHSDVRSWFGEVRDRDAPAEWDRYGEWVQSGLTRADVVVAPTAYQSGLLARHYGRPADVVIPNGIPPLLHLERLAPTSARPLLLTAGRAWDEAKGVAVLDRALELLGEDAPLAQLAGPLTGPDDATYEPRALLGLGSVTPATLLRLYARTGIYVATSYYEPFGLSPLEAANSGCALVLSDIGSFRDLWSGCAEFYEAGNAAALAATIRDLLDDPERMDRLGADAHERAVTRFTAARMGARYADLYLSLGAPHARARRGTRQAAVRTYGQTAAADRGATMPTAIAHGPASPWPPLPLLPLRPSDP